MARILVTSGPTRQYLDPVRYLTNASSGRMGRALAEAAVALGHEVVVVSGPVNIAYPDDVRVRHVMTTEEMLATARQEFVACDGAIAAAAPCDYRPAHFHPDKMVKTGAPVELCLLETPDVVATLGAEKTLQWLVAFALETHDHRARALAKLKKKRCDLIVWNGPEALHADDSRVEIIDQHGDVVGSFAGTKDMVAREILGVIARRLIARRSQAESR